MCYFQCFVDMEDDQNVFSYESLPETILLKIFMKLSLPDRLRAALSCRQWCNIFTSPAAWTTFHFRFYSRKDTRTTPQLESLNIQNDNLVCLVQPESILRLAQRCRRLRELCLHKCSLSQDVLLCFLEENRVALEHLSLQCRSEEIIASHPQDEKTQLSSELWSCVVGRLPKLRVTLHFDQTCPLVVIPLVMKPEVPCAVLRLETFTIIHDMVLQAAYNYSETLEKLILQAPPSAELESALLELSHRCSRLRALHVFCPLSVHTIDNILREHPHMKASGLYTLRSERGTDGPWATDEKVNA
ncbi:hypothetical protein MTO96_016788 [Rhipicephalus appendiculatus]